MQDSFDKAVQNDDTKNATASEQEQLSHNEFHTDMAVGEILRRTRTHYGQSLQQIEQVLRIRATNLDALERGDISKLPGRVYAIGFVRSYSEYLGLDGDKMVHLFKEQSVGRTAKTDLSFPVPAEESKVPNIYIVGISLFGLLIFVLFISFFMFPDKKPNDIPDVPEQLSKSSLSEAPALIKSSTDDVTATQTDAKIVEPAKPTNRLVIEIIEPSWIEIKNATGAAILRQVLKPGDMYLVPPEDGLVMATGNAGGVVFVVDGNKLPPLGAQGEIKRKIILSPEGVLNR